jgi:lipopolysaccharide export system protein LptA
MKKIIRHKKTDNAQWARMSLLMLVVISVLHVVFLCPAHAQKKVKMDKGQPIEIQSDRLDAYQEKRVVIFSGNAVATQGNRTIHADRLLIYYKDRSGNPEKKDVNDIDATGDFERLEAQGRVTITETNRIVTGDHADFYQDTQTIVVIGNAVLRDGKNMINGGKITVYLDEDRGVVESSEGKRVKATVFPNEKEQEKR